MRNSTSRITAKRTTRRRFAHRLQRCIGLERLERRTVFASDLGADLESQVFACSAFEEQPQTTVQPMLVSQIRSESELSTYQESTLNRSTEVASTIVSFVNGDVVAIEVPASSFDYLQFNDQYVLTYSYAQNYFSDTADQALQANALRSIAQSQSSNERFADTRSADADSNDEWAVEAGSLSSQLALNSSDSQVQFPGTVVLASLTATTDFDATIRVFDNSLVGAMAGSHQSDFGARQLPSEIRIEPNLTSPTVLPDPGPTITRTIVVNRQAEGLVLEEQPIKLIGPVKPEPTERQVSASSLGPNTTSSSSPASGQTSVAKPNRSNVTIRTIDISQVRRHDVARPWLRSTVVQNPARQRDFGFEKKTTVVTLNSTTSLPSQATSASKSEKSGRWSSRVSATRLQPVEFLLAHRDGETEKLAVLEDKPAVATDVAMSAYSDASPIDDLENEIFLDGLNAIRLETQTPPSRSEASTNPSTPARYAGEDWWIAMATEMQRLAQYPPANANRDSWKSLVRSASETVAGQAFLATVSTIAAQQKEMSAFGSKSAWEFVTRPVQSGQA